MCCFWTPLHHWLDDVITSVLLGKFVEPLSILLIWLGDAASKTQLPKCRNKREYAFIHWTLHWGEEDGALPQTSTDPSRGPSVPTSNRVFKRVPFLESTVSQVTFFKKWSIVDCVSCVNFCCTAKWFSYTHSFFLFFSIMVCHRILNIVPCAIQ